jgi:hypothetical protein
VLCCVVVAVLVPICDIFDGPLLGFSCLPCPPLFDLLPLRLTVFLCCIILRYIVLRRVNSWLTYGEPLHRLREFGITAKELDLIDEKKLSMEQMRALCSFM